MHRSLVAPLWIDYNYATENAPMKSSFTSPAALLWTLYATTGKTSCKLELAEHGLEVRIVQRRSILSSRVFSSLEEATAWAKQEHAKFVDQGRTDEPLYRARALSTERALAIAPAPRIVRRTLAEGPCCLCGGDSTRGHTRGVPWIAVTSAGKKPDLLGRICLECGTSQPDALKGRIAAHTEVLREDGEFARAANLEELLDAHISVQPAEDIERMKSGRADEAPRSWQRSH